MQKAMQGETDVKKLEFYVTVEYYKNKKHASENVDANNPFPQQKPQTKATTSAKPKEIPKAKGSPAEQKPKSKKEEKGIGEKIAEAGKELWDWFESKGTATKNQEPTRQKPEGKSPAIVKEQKQETAKKGECPRCDALIKPKDLETIFPDASEANRKIVADTYNSYMKDDEFHVSTLNLYYIDKNCDLFLYDTIENDILPIQKKQKKMETKKTISIEFSDLFNEGTNIKFTPNDLNKNTPEIDAFKKKLDEYLNEYPLLDDFDIKNLSALINNETFFFLQYYTSSSWLQYFLTKYEIDASKLKDLMNQAITQEDYNAVKILTNNNYIVSQKDLAIATETEQESKNKIQENKKDGYESYLASNSKIKEISKLLTEKYSKNYIQDSDGYTNLRKDKTATSEVLQKINSGEHIEVLDNSGDWFLVKTKEGKTGYIHKSRIKSN